MQAGFGKKDKYTVDDLVEIMSLLRSENGCPWDREQTHASIRKNFIEETYEAVEAIDEDNPDKLKEELGDVLLQVVFHAQMEKEKGNFDFNDVCDGICKKLIVRHPHVFGNEKADSAEKVLDRWEEIKNETKEQTGGATLDAVPKQLPALMRCAKVQHRAEKAGGCSHSLVWSLGKLDEEVAELKEAVRSNDIAKCCKEMGDVLFSAVNTARTLDIEPEECLTAASEKFIKRFKKAENLAEQSGKKLSEIKGEELNSLWLEAKNI